MARKKQGSEATAENPDHAVRSLRYPVKRKNIPPAGLESHGRVKAVPAMQHSFNPHLSPELKSPPTPHDADRLCDRVHQVIATSRERKLEPDEANVLTDALGQHEPWLEWSGKREKPWFVVDPVALHMHERVSTEAVLRVLRRVDVQRDLFADPQHDYSQAVQFYQHDVDWSNRMILGDSLQVMASLAGREDLAAKVQMIYFDPPYGIRFRSNFQPQIDHMSVTDRVDDLTREPEMVRAYRDTWTLGVHSYLTYIRDRLAMAQKLLAPTGSIFVQISDENIHRVRCVLDEVFGAANFCAVIPFRTTTNQTSESLASTFDFLLWYARDKSKVKSRNLFRRKILGGIGGSKYNKAELLSGERGSFSKLSSVHPPPHIRAYCESPMVSQSGSDHGRFEVDFRGSMRVPRSGYWKTTQESIKRLIRCERIIEEADSLRYVRYFDDFPFFQVSALWDDTAGVQSRSDPKRYVVQTSTKIIERCILLSTDPGDLVLDPTCGGGTTAYVAEKWGRRWITIDTSRVSLALAKQRLMTATFDYFKLRPLSAEDRLRNPNGAWIHSTMQDSARPDNKVTIESKIAPHITLRSIARNTSLDPILDKHDHALDQALAQLNKAVMSVDRETVRAQCMKLITKHRQYGGSAVSDADVRRWLLPNADVAWLRPALAKKPLKAITTTQARIYRSRCTRTGWKHWQVPFDVDPDWPVELQRTLEAYREAWHAKMNEVVGCIAANAETEELVDQPLVDKEVVRVTGPFTVESVIALEDGLHSPIRGYSSDVGQPEHDAGLIAAARAEAHLEKIIRLLRVSGVDFPRNKRMKFQRLDPIGGVGLIHAEGQWLNGNGDGRSVAVSIGPEVGDISSMQIEESVRVANRMGYDDIVYAGFGFDAQAQDAIKNAQHPNLQLHMALIRPDVSMEDLLKTEPGSQLFTVFSSPRVIGPTKRDDGTFVVDVEGMDVYDPVSNSLFPADRGRIAAWFVDTDYDGRTFCICQAFFGDGKGWDRLSRALRSTAGFDPSLFDALCGYQSLPFSPPVRSDGGSGKPWKIAIKVIDLRGNEALRVLDGGGLT